MDLKDVQVDADTLVDKETDRQTGKRCIKIEQIQIQNHRRQNQSQQLR